MAVFTEVTQAEAAPFIETLGLGTLQSLTGCSGGIENTNYFADTDAGQYVLTLFERLTFEQLPFYLQLMKHLAQKGIAVPEPQAIDGKLLHKLKGKPAAVVTKLAGKSELAPRAEHCAQVGQMLAQMHLAGLDFELRQPNLRGLAWWNETVPLVTSHLNPEQTALIRSELAYQNHIASSASYTALPRGPIHADLFRDNVMFEDGKLAGFFDFYFAGYDALLFDLCVCLNDWCIDWESGHQDDERAQAFLAAYQSARLLETAERRLLPAMLRAAALRFWISRLWDFYLPRQASMLKPHDPTHFERVLRARLHTSTHL